MIISNITQYRTTTISPTSRAVSVELQYKVIKDNAVVHQNLVVDADVADLMKKSDYDANGDGMVDLIDCGSFHR